MNAQIRQDAIAGTGQAIDKLVEAISALTPYQRDRAVRVQIRQHLGELAVLREELKELKGL
jgi:hypothetical protein